MENFKKRAIDLVLGLAITEDKVPSVIPYEPSKTWVSSQERKYLRIKNIQRSFPICWLLLSVKNAQTCIT